MESKLNGIKMRKFETKEELVEWIETMHLQNTNGRETEDEMFRLGIESAIEELTEFNLFSIPVVSQQRELLIAWEQYKKANWYESDAVDVEKMLMSQFLAINCG